MFHRPRSADKVSGLVEAVAFQNATPTTRGGIFSRAVESQSPGYETPKKEKVTAGSASSLDEGLSAERNRFFGPGQNMT